MRTVYRNRLRLSQAPRALDLAVVAIAVFFAPGGAASAAPDCAPAPARITTVRSISAPEIDNSLTQPQLQRIATHRHPGRSLGLYRASVDGHFDARIEVRWDEREACLWVAGIALRIEATERRIWVIRERRPGTCAYDAVLAHEQRHQAVDEAVIDAFVPRLEAALARRAAALGVVRVAPAGREAAQNRVLSAINEIFQAEMRAMQAERERQQQAVDTPAEYRRIGAACDPLRNKG